jgi:hypothetical protein
MSKLSKAARALGGMTLAVGSVLPAMTVGTATLVPTRTVWAQESTKDVVIFRSGKIVEGTILEETTTSIRMKVSVGGIEAETTYAKTDILSITRAPKADPSKPDAKAAAKDAGKPAPKAEEIKVVKSEPGISDAKKVYMIELTGWFGEDISQTPIRQAVKDAKKHDADYLIVMLDNDWSLKRFGRDGDIKDDVGQFDQLFRTEDMEPIFTEEIPHEWTKQPQIVFWVKKAMGGAAFLPLNCKTIYFSSDAKMGGIGHLNKIFGSTGDKVVQEKQFSLRLGHAEGMAIQGGYDPKLIKAMARDEYVLSYKVEGGKPVYLERMPESPDEFLLTDDGEASNEDGEIQLARGEGNDCLTLNADVAYKLGVSKGTVDTLDDLLFQLGIARNSTVVKGQSAQIMKGWRDGLESAKRQLPKLWRDVNQVEVKAPGGYRERSQARGRRKSLMEEMQAIEKKYEEALNPAQLRVPGWNDLETLKKQIDLEQLGDKPDRK